MKFSWKKHFWMFSFNLQCERIDDSFMSILLITKYYMTQALCAKKLNPIYSSCKKIRRIIRLNRLKNDYNHTPLIA
jgi:hypothetical protein